MKKFFMIKIMLVTILAMLVFVAASPNAVCVDAYDNTAIMDIADTDAFESESVSSYQEIMPFWWCDCAICYFYDWDCYCDFYMDWCGDNWCDCCDGCCYFFFYECECWYCDWYCDCYFYGGCWDTWCDCDFMYGGGIMCGSMGIGLSGGGGMMLMILAMMMAVLMMVVLARKKIKE